MQNIQLHFSHPWLLLLLIPAVFFTLFSYFRLNKRYRCTRNRIISIVLHICVMFFSIFTLAGFVIRYDIPNEKNELIILVDKSNSEDEEQEAIDSYVNSVLKEGKYQGFNMGIVTFGFDQKYVLPLTDNLDGAFDAYLAAELPDVSATNIAAALTYTQALFNNLDSGKILLVTDGKETDEEAKQVILGVSSQGLSVDVAFVPSNYTEDDAQIVGITLPEYYVKVGDECEISVTIESKGEQEFYVALYDNGEMDPKKVQQVATKTGVQTVSFRHEFQGDGLHEIRFRMEPVNKDGLLQNNEYCTYHYLETFDKVLIVERTEGDSATLVEMLNADTEKSYDITPICISDENLPKDVNVLRGYDQVILNNISNAVMPDGFDEILSEYVNDFGGGLFTVGGKSDDNAANAYTPSDMYGTVYQEMLPVQAINYTPPVGVMIIIDRSGSMEEDHDDKGNSYFEGAKAGAIACLDELTERDYIGVMMADEEVEVILQLTSRTQERKIKDSISSVEKGNLGKGLILSSALKIAAAELNVYQDKVAKRHIIFVTDGNPSEKAEQYQTEIKKLADTGITLSVIAITLKHDDGDMQAAAVMGNGKYYPTSSVKELIGAMKTDLGMPSIKDVNDEVFNPKIYDMTSSLVSDLEKGTGVNSDRLTVELGGFFGSKIKPEANLILTGNYNVPLYAQWKYGKGTVGSFMCDLQKSEWSKSFVENENGKKLIQNIVDYLMPTENIRPKSINITLKEDNYTNTLSVLTDLKQGEKIVGEIVRTTEAGDVVVPLDKVTDVNAAPALSACYVTMPFSTENNYTRCGFIVKESGVYRIVLRKIDDSGKVLCEETFYKSFSYSEEYDSITEETQEDVRARLVNLADQGKGKLLEDLEDPYSIFIEFEKVIEQMYDPRTLFMILAIILFLADVAIRKFKFKWLHEIIRDRKKRPPLK